MKHIIKILSLLMAIFSMWISLLQMSIVSRDHTWLLPIYLVISLGCYGLFMVGIGLMQFPTCPQEAVLLQQDIFEAKEFLKQSGSNQLHPTTVLIVTKRENFALVGTSNFICRCIELMVQSHTDSNQGLLLRP